MKKPKSLKKRILGFGTIAFATIPIVSSVIACGSSSKDHNKVADQSANTIRGWNEYTTVKNTVTNYNPTPPAGALATTTLAARSDQINVHLRADAPTITTEGAYNALPTEVKNLFQAQFQEISENDRMNIAQLQYFFDTSEGREQIPPAALEVLTNNFDVARKYIAYQTLLIKGIYPPGMTQEEGDALREIFDDFSIGIPIFLEMIDHVLAVSFQATNYIEFLSNFISFARSIAADPINDYRYPAAVTVTAPPSEEQPDETNYELGSFVLPMTTISSSLTNSYYVAMFVAAGLIEFAYDPIFNPEATDDPFYAMAENLTFTFDGNGVPDGYEIPS